MWWFLMMGKRWHFKRRKYVAKTGLMYSENFAKYDAGGAIFVYQQEVCRGSVQQTITIQANE